MPVLNDKEYECDLCHKVFELVRDSHWNEEKAKEEFHKNFPNANWNKRSVVCDDCWVIIEPHSPVYEVE